MMQEDEVPLQDRTRRAKDRGWLCWCAARAADTWDFVDKRDIDKHGVSLAVLYGTVKVIEWAMRYASEAHSGMTGTDIAAIIAAVTAPYSALQAAAIGFYFNSRRG